MVNATELKGENSMLTTYLPSKIIRLFHRSLKQVVNLSYYLWNTGLLTRLKSPTLKPFGRFMPSGEPQNMYPFIVHNVMNKMTIVLFFFFLLVRHMRLSKWKDYTVSG